jgi:hypothetical protein
MLAARRLVGALACACCLALVAAGQRCLPAMACKMPMCILYSVRKADVWPCKLMHMGGLNVFHMRLLAFSGLLAAPAAAQDNVVYGRTTFVVTGPVNASANPYVQARVSRTLAKLPPPGSATLDGPRPSTTPLPSQEASGCGFGGTDAAGSPRHPVHFCGAVRPLTPSLPRQWPHTHRRTDCWRVQRAR